MQMFNALKSKLSLTRDEVEPKPDMNSSRINALSAIYPL